jgi:hypothetical protein
MLLLACHTGLFDRLRPGTYVGGGSVDVLPEAAYEGGPINYRHVNVREGPNRGGFSEPYPNPITNKADRIPGRSR